MTFRLTNPRRPPVRCVKRPLMLLLAVGLFSLFAETNAVAGQDPLDGAPAPAADVALPVVGGERAVALADYRGKYIVLHFGASW